MYLTVITVTALGFLASSAQAGPQKIILTSRAKPSRHRPIGPSTIPLNDFFLNTDLQWFGNISVGTPPQEQTVVFDTGSSTLEITSTLCGQACANQVKFDPSKSSTFVDGGAQFSISFTQTGVGVDPVVNNDYTLDLRSGADTVSIGGLTAANTSLFLITNQTAKFGIDTFSGILGMGTRTAEGLFGTFIKQGLPSLFSLYLTPKSVGNAEIIIGGIDESKFKGTPIYSSLSSPRPGDTNWTLISLGLFINGRTTPLLNSSRFIIFDSGTSNVVFSTNTTNAIYAMISPDIKPNPNEPGAYGIPCHLISSLPARIDITFTSQKGVPFNLTIPSSEFNLGPFANDLATCQTLINAFDGLEVLGGSFLKHYYSIWDVGGQRLGFAPARGVPRPDFVDPGSSGFYSVTGFGVRAEVVDAFPELNENLFQSVATQAKDRYQLERQKRIIDVQTSDLWSNSGF